MTTLAKDIAAAEEKLTGKVKRRERKRKPTMRVSGKRVFQLRNVIRKRSKKQIPT